MQGLPQKTYTKVNEHYKQYGIDFVTGEPYYAKVSTIMLDACVRAIYKEMKNSYKKGLTEMNFGV